MSLKYEPASEPLHMSVNTLCRLIGLAKPAPSNLAPASNLRDLEPLLLLLLVYYSQA